MQIYPRIEFSADVTAKPFEDPLAICAAASAQSKLTFNDQDRDVLSKVEDFSAPYVIACKAFDASKISAPTPDAMIPHVAESGRALIATLNLVSSTNLCPLSYEYENNGQLAVNLSPQRPDSIDQRSYEKSKKDLRGHTDAVFNPSPCEYSAGEDSYSPSPDFVAIACIRNPDAVATRLALLSDILPMISEKDKQELQGHNYIITPQPSFDLPDDAIRGGPVLWRDATGTWCCRFSHSHVVADELSNPAAAAALGRFREAISQSFKSIVLQPGEILLFNNRTAIHGRDKVGSDWNPSARWMLRMYANRKSTPKMSPYSDRSWLVR